MEILYARCAGLDIHNETVAACVLTPRPGAEPNREIEEFGTTAADLRRLLAWAAGARRDPRCNGIHRGVLEAGVQLSRKRLPVDSGQCASHQAAAGAQDRHGRLRLDRLAAAARIPGSLFRFGGGGAAVARPVPDAHHAGTGTPAPEFRCGLQVHSNLAHAECHFATITSSIHLRQMGCMNKRRMCDLPALKHLRWKAVPTGGRVRRTNGRA